MKKLIAALVAILISNLSVAATSGYHYDVSYVLQWGVPPDWPPEEVIDTRVGCGMLFSLTKLTRLIPEDEGHSEEVISVEPVDGLTCIVSRDNRAIARVTTTGPRTYFTDYDVVPGVTYTYAITYTGHTGFGPIEMTTTGPTNVTCSLIYSADIATNEMAFSDSESENKVPVSIYEQTVGGSRLLGRYEAYFGTTASDDWIYPYRSDDCKYCHICVDENNSDEPREGVVTINFEGVEWKIKVKQAGKQSNVMVDTGNGEVTIPTTWYSENCAALLAEHGGDHVATALADAANGMKIWECYVAGLAPTNENSHFEAKIEMKDGAPVITWLPNLNENGVTRNYTIYGKTSLSDEENWVSPTNSLHRFFKVGVEMP